MSPITSLLQTLFRRGQVDRNQPTPETVRTNLTEIAQAFLTGRSSPESDWGPDQMNATVYTCETIIATAAAWVPFKLWKVDKNRKYVEIEDHPLLSLFRNPWPNMYSDFAQMIETIFYNLESTGNAWILEDAPTSLGLPRALMVFGSQHVKPLTDDAGKLVGWELKVSANTKPLRVPLAQMHHIKYTHPFSQDQILGFGPLQAARISLRGERARTAWEATFYKNGARPSFALTYKPPETRSEDIFLTEKQLEQIRAGIESEWGGESNAGKVAIIHGGMDLKPLAISQKDMDFIETKKWSRQEIASVFRIPVPLLNDFQHAGLGREGVSVADRMLYSNNVVPKLKRLSSIFQRVFVERYAKGFYGAFDTDEIPAMRNDIGEKSEVAERFHKMGWPINAINRVLDLGFEDVPWGDEAWLPNNMMTATQINDAIERGETPLTAGEVIASEEAASKQQDSVPAGKKKPVGKTTSKEAPLP